MKTLLLKVGGGIKNAIQFVLRPPVRFIADQFSSAPRQEKVFDALSNLYTEICSQSEPGKHGRVIDFRPEDHPVVLFSDHHKGSRNNADDFADAEENYLAALSYYQQEQYYYISLGDSEELWENNIFQVLKHNEDVFASEKTFVENYRFVKIVGNHDLFWDQDPFAPLLLKKMFGRSIPVYRGVVLRVRLALGTLDFFCTHGHQGDAQSDGNRFSKWFVSYIWGPLQSFLDMNTNSPSANQELKSLHNRYMYEWSSGKQNLILITGHTHQPVFRSLTHLERLYLELEKAKEENDIDKITQVVSELPRREKEYKAVRTSFRQMKPVYFNTGCCCYADGTITGLEIAGGTIQLIKWHKVNSIPTRVVLESCPLTTLFEEVYR